MKWKIIIREDNKFETAILTKNTFTNLGLNYFCYEPIKYKINAIETLIYRAFNQHHLKRRSAHRKVATSQTSELVDKAPKTCNSFPDAIFK